MVIRARVCASALLSLALLLFCTCASSNPAGGGVSRGSASGGASGGRQPDWVSDPYTRYDSQVNVAVVGRGSSRDQSEKDALGRLIAVFGQSIQVDEKVSTAYEEAVKSGVTASWSETTTVASTIATSASMDSLVGAETGETWDDGKGTFFTVAFLNKTKAFQIYSEIIRSNQAMINNLVNIPAAERNTLEGFARYQFAATIADVTASYANLVSVIGGNVQGLKSGNDYRLEAANITKVIPVGLRVQNDKSGRLQGAFAKAISDLGFRSGGTNSRYLLDVSVFTSPVTISGNPYNWTRIEVNANLSDTGSGTVLLPFSFNTREGHTSQGEADNRAYMAAEQKINEEYSTLLSDYLSKLLPKK